MNDRMNELFAQIDQLYYDGDVNATEAFLVSVEENIEKYSTAEQIVIYNELGAFYRAVSKYEKSLQAFEKARVMIAEEIGSGMQYATLLNNMAGTYRLMQDYEKSEALFVEAKEIYKAEHLEDTYEYVSLLNNMALVYREMSEYQKAICCLYCALDRLEPMEDCQQELAITYNNLMALHFALGEYEQAKYCVNRALKEFEKCEDYENVHYAAGLNSMAALLYKEEFYDQALEMYEKSMKYTLRFFGQNEEYAKTLMNMYWAYKALGREKEAIRSVEKSVKVYQNLYGNDDAKTIAAINTLNNIKQVI